MRPQISGALLALAILLALPSGSGRAADNGDALAALVSAAKAEGAVTVGGPAIDVVRQAMTSGFEAKYGITVTYLSAGGGPSSARVRAERAAGKYLLDVLVSGPDSPLLTFLPSGWLDRIEPALIDPDVLNPKKWRDGHLWYADPQHTILRTIQYVTPELAVNTKVVNPKEIPTWKSLLDPKWKGKLLVKDPTTSGSGQSLTSFLYLTFGPDFVRKLYKDQQPVFTRDARQASQWLAQGTYGIWVGTEFSTLETFRKLGYPVEAVAPTDGPGILTGSDGLISLINRAPHPNAAKLYVNWIAGREGGALFAKALLAASLRTDFKQDWVPSYEVIHPGVKYIDAYDYKFVTVERDAALAKVRELLGF
jgi:iron(III) transport system substrate-binding protein